MRLESYIPVKPPVEAVQLTEDNLADVIAWINSQEKVRGYNDAPAATSLDYAPGIKFHAASDSGSAFVAKIGQWITRNGWGGFKVYTETGFNRVHREAGDVL